MATHPGKDTRMNELAEWMAVHGGTVAEAGRALGWEGANTRQVWGRIRRRLGWQAQ